MPLHPELAARLHLLDGLTDFQTAMEDPAQKARLDAFIGLTDAPPPPSVHVHDAEAPGPHGEVPVRVYRPDEPSAPGAAAPALVWLHGGGFMGGDLDMPEADWTSRQICARTGAVVVSVDYRLAVGGVRYPVPHDDAVAATRWVRDTAASLGVDAGRISLGGASAGGNLSAGAALRLRDQDGWQPRALLLAYPVLHPVIPPAGAAGQARMAEIPALLRFPPEVVGFLTANYLGGPASTADGYAMPALAVLDGLAPTLVLTAEYDDLRPSGEHFAAALALAGVDVQLHTARGVLHGFLNGNPGLAPVGEALALMARTVAGP